MVGGELVEEERVHVIAYAEGEDAGRSKRILPRFLRQRAQERVVIDDALGRHPIGEKDDDGGPRPICLGQRLGKAKVDVRPAECLQVAYPLDGGVCFL